MGPTYRALPVGMRFRPSDLELAVYFLIKKALGLPMKALTVPDECNDIFSTHPRDLPGYGSEEHWYFYFIENEEEEESDNKNGDEEEPPQCNWFLDEISLPLTVVDTDWTLCHIFYEKVKPEFGNLHIVESESESEEEEEDESVDKPAESLDSVKEKDGTVLPPPPATP